MIWLFPTKKCWIAASSLLPIFLVWGLWGPIFPVTLLRETIWVNGTKSVMEIYQVADFSNDLVDWLLPWYTERSYELNLVFVAVGWMLLDYRELNLIFKYFPLVSLLYPLVLIKRKKDYKIRWTLWLVKTSSCPGIPL